VETWKEFDQNIITHSAAHHLMAIDDLMSRFGYARVSDIARRLNITRGSVSISLKPLKEAGLILQDENRHLRLSEHGQKLVNAIKGKRHVIQRLFSEILGVDEQQADIDACKIEHLISGDTARRIIAFFRFLDSREGPTPEFLSTWRAYETECDQRPEGCPTCEDKCMAKDVSEP
jgi:DtxR family transcriptional regulator, Mn-dependent transcriptional regulator